MSLIESLKSEIGTTVIDQISKRAGVTSDQAGSAIATGVPAVLAGILKNGSSSNGSGFLGNLLTSVGDFLPGVEDDTQDDGLLNKGKALLSNLFGNNLSTLTNSVVGQTGLTEEKSTGLLAITVPFITGAISKLVSKNGWSVTDLMGKIFENKSEITDALPGDLKTGLSLAGVSLPNVSLPKVGIPGVKINHDETNKSFSFLKWLLPVILVALLAWFLLAKGCNNGDVESGLSSIKNNGDTALNVVKGKLNDAGDYIFDLGDTISVKLPNGTDISIGENSAENHLLNFIKDESKPVDKTTWFTFDRLYFETGKSILKVESKTQIINIAAILKAYPAVNIKLGGYTDSTGDAEVNKNISAERANVALKALVALGIDASRLEAEGYGQEHPVASNETPEGRAQNRRIDVRVTKK